MLKRCGFMRYFFVLLVLHAKFVCSARIMDFYMLRNAGLQTTDATSLSDCIDKCTGTCSAMSYQFSTGVCLLSICNQLDLVKVTGWNSRIMLSDYLLEINSGLPPLDFEWMLTDSCGSSNMGATNGPKVNLYNVTYTSSQSVYAGNAVTFAGNTASYGRTDTDSVLNYATGTQSYTMMFWLKWNSLPTSSDCASTDKLCYTFYEFFQGSSVRGHLLWYYYGGPYISLGDPSVYIYGGNLYPSFLWSLTAGIWYHVAVQYDGTNYLYQTFINGELRAVSSMKLAATTAVWDTIFLAVSPFDKRAPLNGPFYCMKYIKAALSINQINSLAASCNEGKVRLA